MSDSDSATAAPGPLRPAETSEVLRYWLSALRFEEALASRPRAHKLRRDPVVDMARPRGGQPYFKLRADTDGAALMARTRATLTVDLDRERTAFFVRWLNLVYLRERSPLPGWDGDPSAVVLGWPVVYFPRTEELAGLFRMRCSLRWYDEKGKRFTPPSWKARRTGDLPPPPVQVQLVATDEDEGLLPYSLDMQLLTRTLGVTDEELADLEAVLKATEDLTPNRMVGAVCHLLETTEGWTAEVPADDEEDADALFARVMAAIRGRLATGRGTPSVYGVGLVHDGDQIMATRHLQREIGYLLERRVGSPPWGQRTPLWGYMSGSCPPAGWTPMRGLRAARPLTGDQRAVGERFLASPLSAAQGPPGTGKTELLANLAAAVTVERISEIADGGSMPRDLLLVASTNNRAVDHVLEPLADVPEGPPLGLRLGNLQVMMTTTVDLLLRTMSWLESQPTRTAAEHDRRLADALERFRAVRTVVDAADRPRIEARRVEERARKLDGRIAARTAALSLLGEADPPPPEAAREAIDRRLRALDAQTHRIIKIISKGGPDLLGRVMTVWKMAQKRVLRPLEKEIGALAHPVELAIDLPPDVENGADEDAHIEAWQAGLDDARAATDAVRAVLDARRDVADHRAALERLEDERALLPDVTDPPEGADAADHHALFLAALHVRAIWAETHRDRLRTALTTVVESLSERRTLRRLADDDPNTIDWIDRLYPVWGSTLLSLGNVLPAQPVTGLRLVIDEAGQCHPAYAVAGLLRAEQALLIGDVHQLEPVIQLRPTDEARVRGAAGVRLELARLQPYRVMEGSFTSAQALADRAVGDRPTLHTHFRCQAPIIALSDALCGYGLVVRTPPPTAAAPLPGPVLLTAVRGEQIRVRGSWHNPAELDVVMQILRGLQLRGVPWGEVAVITPYVGQLEALRDAARRARIPLENRPDDAIEQDLFADAGLALGTVHRFQGGERRVVVFSTVVTRKRSLGFLNRRVNLINVAVSRAREHLVIVGDPSALVGGPYSKLLVERATPLQIGGPTP